MAWPDTDVGQFVQVQIQGTLFNGQAFRNSFHLWGHDSASPVAVDDLTGLLASAGMDDVIAKWEAMMSTTSTLDGVLARQVFDPVNPTDTKNEAFRSVAGNGGVAVSNLAPTEVSILMKFGADAAGKSAHGRLFLPWSYDKDEMVGELISTTVQTRALALATSLLKFAYNSGSHWTGAAADFDLALYSVTRRRQELDQYGYRVVSASVPRRLHWLRSRGPRA